MKRLAALLVTLLLAAVAATQTGPTAPDASKPQPRAIALRPAPKQAVQKPAAPKATDDKPAASLSGKGRRDPFVSIIAPPPADLHPCSTGKRCLLISQVVLRGVAQGAGGMLAVVESPQRRTYFLRVDEKLFNGEVAAITKEAVTFRERSLDRAGRVHMRDVVKRVDGKAPEIRAVEGKQAGRKPAG